MSQEKCPTDRPKYCGNWVKPRGKAYCIPSGHTCHGSRALYELENRWTGVIGQCKANSPKYNGDVCRHATGSVQTPRPTNSVRSRVSASRPRSKSPPKEDAQLGQQPPGPPNMPDMMPILIEVARGIGTLAYTLWRIVVWGWNVLPERRVWWPPIRDLLYRLGTGGFSLGSNGLRKLREWISSLNLAYTEYTQARDLETQQKAQEDLQKLLMNPPKETREETREETTIRRKEMAKRPMARHRWKKVTKYAMGQAKSKSELRAKFVLVTKQALEKARSEKAKNTAMTQIRQAANNMKTKRTKTARSQTLAQIRRGANNMKNKRSSRIRSQWKTLSNKAQVEQLRLNRKQFRIPSRVSNNTAKKEVRRLKQRRDEKSQTMKYRPSPPPGRTVTIRDIRKKSSNNGTGTDAVTVQSSVATPKSGV